MNVVATNNSWGGSGFSQGLLDAIVRAANAEHPLCRGGRQRRSSARQRLHCLLPVELQHTSAAGYEAVIAVAALCGSASGYCPGGGTLATFSSYGATKVDLAAPGVDIYSDARKQLQLLQRHVDGDTARHGRGLALQVGQCRRERVGDQERHSRHGDADAGTRWQGGHRRPAEHLRIGWGCGVHDHYHAQAVATHESHGECFRCRRQPLMGRLGHRDTLRCVPLDDIWRPLQSDSLDLDYHAH